LNATWYKRYVPFVPEADGQAVLANFNRVLKYKGAPDAQRALERGMWRVRPARF